MVLPDGWKYDKEDKHKKDTKTIHGGKDDETIPVGWISAFMPQDIKKLSFDEITPTVLTVVKITTQMRIFLMDG